MRSVKQLVILVITVSVLGLTISAGGFLLSRIFADNTEPEDPYQTPYQTPDEGPSLDSLEVLNVQALLKQGNIYDIVIQLRNPNPEHGAEELRYKVVFSNNGSEVHTIEQTSYILPAEEKYIVLTNMEVNSFFDDVSVDLRDVLWRQLDDFISLNLDVFDLKLERMLDSNVFYARLAAFIKNNSVFGLTDVRVFGILFDSRGDIIAVNRTSIQTVLEGEMREVEMFWPQAIPLDDVVKYNVYAYSNVLKNENFVRQFGVDRPIGSGDSRGDADSRNYFQLPELFKRFQGWSVF